MESHLFSSCLCAVSSFAVGGGTEDNSSGKQMQAQNCLLCWAEHITPQEVKCEKVLIA